MDPPPSPFPIRSRTSQRRDVVSYSNEMSLDEKKQVVDRYQTISKESKFQSSFFLALQVSGKRVPLDLCHWSLSANKLNVYSFELGFTS